MVRSSGAACVFFGDVIKYRQICFGEKKMTRVKITVLRKADYQDLQRAYENPIERPCEVHEGDVFWATGEERPMGLCESAWETMLPFVRELLRREFLRRLDEKPAFRDALLQRRLSPRDFLFGSLPKRDLRRALRPFFPCCPLWVKREPFCFPTPLGFPLGGSGATSVRQPSGLRTAP